MVYFANCHLHSTFSDADYTPEELVEVAAELGHKAIVLTDHDTIRGCYRLQKAARKKGLLSLLGCEFSTEGLGLNFHLAGFDFNPLDANLLKLMNQGCQKQSYRSQLLLQWAAEKGNIRGNVQWQDVVDAFPENDYLCCNQIWEVLSQKGLYKPEEYKAWHRENFSGRDKEREAKIREMTGFGYPKLEDVVKAIRKAGGVPVVAHPKRDMMEHAEALVEMGVMGFETHHPDMEEEVKQFFDRFCDERGLYKMGGTDHQSILGGHHPNKSILPDSGGVTEEDFMKLYQRTLG